MSSKVALDRHALFAANPLIDSTAPATMENCAEVLAFVEEAIELGSGDEFRKGLCSVLAVVHQALRAEASLVKAERGKVSPIRSAV